MKPHINLSGDSTYYPTYLLYLLFYRAGYLFKPNTNLELGNQIIILPTNRTYERIVLHTKGPTCLLSYLPTGHINSLSYLPTGHTNSLSLATKRTYQQDIRTHCPTYQQDIQAYYPTHKQDIQTHCPTYQQDLHAYNPTYQQEIPTRCPTYQKNLTTGYTCLLSHLLTGHTNSVVPTERTIPAYFSTYQQDMPTFTYRTYLVQRKGYQGENPTPNSVWGNEGLHSKRADS